MRKTIVVCNRHAWRCHRTQAAFEGNHGLQVFTIEQVAARLAGGFLQLIDSDRLQTAICASLSMPLGELDAIKMLPGFQRATAKTLYQAWTAGLDFGKELAAAAGAAATKRLSALSALERQALLRLPKNQLRPRELVAIALRRVRHAKSIFGPIAIFGHTELSPVWRPLLNAIAQVTAVSWIAGARHVPAWGHATGIAVETSAPRQPVVRAISCASPRHEILETLRWARQKLVLGALPQQIAIAAAAPEAWDDHMLALAQAADLPVHFVHGWPAIGTCEGQAAAALAEVLLRGFSRMRIIRLVALLRTHNKRFADLPDDWWRLLPEDAPLLDAERWQKAIAALAPENFADGADHRLLLGGLVETLGKGGLAAAADLGEQLLEGRALAVWRKALTHGPAAALDVTLAGLRVDDGREPEASILWAPAAALAAVSRPFVWLVGLTSRSWPRRATEDPLLPEHVIAAARIDPLPVHQADRRDFRSIRATTELELVCSRARRDSEGRVNGISPLYPRDVQEMHFCQSRSPEHAVTATDRLFARPSEFAALPLARCTRSTWIDWHSDRITAHDGRVRPNHPLLAQALARRQSASSLVKLLRDPLGYLWTYGFGWSEPQETDEPLNLDALAFGNLIHEILQETVTRLEAARPGGLAKAFGGQIGQAVEAAMHKVAARWDDTCPVPPPVVWQRKCTEAAELAASALDYQEEPLAGQRSWAEIPFGGGRGARDLDEAVRGALPWDPYAPVTIPGSTIRIGGAIDRLDLSGDGSRARVTDYKTGRLKKPPQLKGGAELQRCLYAYAVKALVATRPEVEARLLFPRGNGQILELAQPEATLDKLTGFLIAAAESFAAGMSLPGPAAEEPWYDMAFALPAGARQSYLETKRPLMTAALAAIAPIWEEV